MSAFAQITVPIATEERTTSSSTAATAVGELEHDDRITVRGSAPQYPSLLADALMHRKDLVLDFTSLKACLHPLTENTVQETEQVRSMFSSSTLDVLGAGLNFESVIMILLILHAGLQLRRLYLRMA